MTVVFARCEAGVVGEARRITHVFRLAEGRLPEVLEALCGKEFPPGVLELMRPWAGMACLLCTVNLPDGRGEVEGARA